jgi:aspartate kinase
MIGVPGIAARVFSAVAEAGANVLMISQSSSEYNICFAIPRGEQLRVVAALRRAFERELGVGDISAIDVYDDISVLAAVGEGMRGTPGVAGRLFSTLGRHGINVIAIAQGSSELNISFVVQAKDRINALRCIHQEFVE